jgi:hypothetical protein
MSETQTKAMSETQTKAQSGFKLSPQDELNDLRMSDKALPLFNAVKAFIQDVAEPASEEWHRLGEGRPDPWQYAPGQLEVLEAAKEKAKAAGLWNFFLPNAETGEGLSNLDYAYIAVELGKVRLASEIMNCAAPDTGNMEVLERVGTPEQKKQWLEPLLEGKIRSAYCMTELNTASSDAKNIDTRAVLVGNEYIINGEKHYISGAGSPRCKIMICMVRTGGENDPPQLQQSQILVPLPTPGVEIVGGQHVFGDPASSGSRSYSPLHARDRLGGKGSGPAGHARHDPRRVRQADHPAGRQPRDRQPCADRDRSYAPDGSESRQSHGRTGQPRSPRLDPHGQGHGARAGLQDHRSGDPDVWRPGRVATHPTGAHVRQHPHPAHRRRPR